MAFNFNTWGGSWGSSWGNSWGAQEEDSGPERIASGGSRFSRYRWETTRIGLQVLEEDRMLLEAIPGIVEMFP